MSRETNFRLIFQKFFLIDSNKSANDFLRLYNMYICIYSEIPNHQQIFRTTIKFISKFPIKYRNNAFCSIFKYYFLKTEKLTASRPFKLFKDIILISKISKYAECAVNIEICPQLYAGTKIMFLMQFICIHK